MIGRVFFAIAFLLSFATAGCAPMPRVYQPALHEEGEIHVYLQPLPQEAHRLEISISALYAIRDDGELTQLHRLLPELKGKDLVGVQKRLASATLSPGAYKGIAIQIGKVSVLGEEGAADLLFAEEPQTIELEFTVVRRMAEALFLTLDPANLIGSGFRFTPTFSLAKSRRQLRSLLGFSTNSESNLVSVFNKHTMEVVDTIATGSGPKGAALDQREGWVYVAIAGEDAIDVIDVDTGEILRRLQLNFGDEPIELALTPDRAILISANYGSNSASIIDAFSLREIGRVSLPAEPTDVVMDSTSRRAYILQPRSNAVSVIDLSRREILTTRILDDIPMRGAVSRDGNSLYIVTRYSSDLLVVDALGLDDLGRIFVGSDSVSVAVDPNTGLVYVGNRVSGISVIDPSSLLPIDRYRLRGHAEFIAIDNDENCLFVVLPGRGTIQKTDIVSKKARGNIEVGEGGYGLVIMGSR
jgi:YVTN family beta-propeller protein